MPTKEQYRVAAYCRLSREDGDRVESDSIVNQQRAIEDFCRASQNLEVVEVYADDGFTGTNFERPNFKRMLKDIEAGWIDCIVVKDLSRFGRDYIDMGFYLERYFPEKGVRFIAVNDGVDSGGGAYDLLLPIRNVFNTQYAKDVSEKVKSAFKSKQRRGEFCGAFACYGYRKAPEDNDRLIVDPAAAETVQRIFLMAAEGLGKQAIADRLNGDGVPCPIEYKRLMGAGYRNGERPSEPYRWTYMAVHRILHNETYLGNMVANRNARRQMHGKARANEKSEWIVVEGTHEPIIPRVLWDAVQAQTNQNARAVDAAGHGGLLTGFLRCGDCGRPLVKIAWNRKTAYSCGSYHRHGSAVCSKHYIMEEDVKAVVLRDLNRIIGHIDELKDLAERNQLLNSEGERRAAERVQIETALERARGLKQAVYEDYRDGLLSREEYESYRADYGAQLDTLRRQLAQLEKRRVSDGAARRPWVDKLIKSGRLTGLDRATLAQTVETIRVFEGRRIEIAYRFSEKAGAILNG